MEEQWSNFLPHVYDGTLLCSRTLPTLLVVHLPLNMATTGYRLRNHVLVSVSNTYLRRSLPVIRPHNATL